MYGLLFRDMILPVESMLKYAKQLFHFSMHMSEFRFTIPRLLITKFNEPV